MYSQSQHDRRGQCTLHDEYNNKPCYFLPTLYRYTVNAIIEITTIKEIEVAMWLDINVMNVLSPEWQNCCHVDHCFIIWCFCSIVCQIFQTEYLFLFVVCVQSFILNYSIVSKFLFASKVVSKFIFLLKFLSISSITMQ